jgi:hypothetical protein
MKVTNRSSATTIYRIPEDHIKRKFAPGETKFDITEDEIRKLANSDNAYVSENFAKTFFGDKVKDLESSGKLKRTNIKINSSTDNKRIYDYFKESSQNGLWDKDEHRVQGFTPKAMKAYKMDKSAISDLQIPTKITFFLKST